MFMKTLLVAPLALVATMSAALADGGRVQLTDELLDQVTAGQLAAAAAVISITFTDTQDNDQFQVNQQNDFGDNNAVLADELTVE